MNSKKIGMESGLRRKWQKNHKQLYATSKLKPIIF